MSHKLRFPIGARVVLSPELRRTGVKGPLAGVVVGYTKNKSVGFGVRGAKGHGVNVRVPGHRSVLTIGQDWLTVERGNPRRRVTRKRARPIRQSLRVVARGMQRRVRRAFGGRGMKLNPMSKRNYEFMARYIAGLKAAGADAQVIDALLEFAVATIRADGNPRFDAERFTLVALGGKYHRKNPALALVGANPRGGKYLGRCTEVRYLRETGAHRGRYRHPFKTRARLLAMPNGSLAIIGG